jgi:hypothetical protein
VVLADLLEESYAKALAAEKNPVLRAALESWPSVHEVIGRRSSINSSADPAPARS